MPSRSLGTLTLDLVARTSGFVAGMSKADRESDKFKRKVKRNMEDTAKAIRNVAVVASGALVGAFGAVVAASAKQEAALRQVEQRLTSTNNAVGKSVDELAALAAELQSVSTFGDEDILKAQSQLLTFTNIAGDTFDRTLTSVLDLSVAMDTDLKSSVVQLGKALNDPVANLSALSRSGIQFSDSQKEMIKSLAESGRLAEAQAVILGELETQFGGAAAAAADTFGGALKQVQNAFGDLLENPAGLEANKEALQELTAFLQDPATIQAAQELTAALISGFRSVGEVVKDTLGAVKFLSEEFAAIRYGAAADDLVRLDEQLEKTKSALENPSERLRFFGPGGVVEYWNEEELKSEIKRLEGAIETERKRLETKFSAGPGSVVGTVGGTSVAANDPVTQIVGCGQAAAAQEETARAVKETADAYDSQAAAAMAAKEAIEAQAEAAQVAADAQARINEEAQSIADSLRSEEQMIEDSYKRRRDIILENTEITGQEANDILLKLGEERAQALADIEAQRNQQIAEGYSALLDIVGEYYQGMQGEQAGYARTALALGQALLDEDKRKALQSIVANTAETAMKAYNALSGIPYVGPVLGAAAAGAVYVAGGAAAAKVTGLAHDGIDEVPTSGTWLLEKGERVTTEQTSKKLDKTLDKVQMDQKESAGNSQQNIRIVNAFEQQIIGDYMGSDAGEQVIMNAVKRNQATIRRISAG